MKLRLTHLRNGWGALRDSLAAILFPANCRVCEQLLEQAARIPVCPDCLNQVQRITEPICARCGRPLFTAATLTENFLCRLCRQGRFAFQLVRSYAVYDDLLVRLIILLKHHGIKPLGAWCAQRLLELTPTYPDVARAEAIVPVPLHPLRLRERGYNQAEWIARPLARQLGIPLQTNLLARVKPRPEKLKLTRRERWEAVRGAFATTDPAKVDNLRVLLVDDVFTTGATLDACARALLRTGAAQVMALTVGRVVPRWTRQLRNAPGSK
ncbi:MAG: ComF family protein [Firmicutes bacterium]|nr:ComF family protein [Bacillota bacterium]